MRKTIMIVIVMMMFAFTALGIDSTQLAGSVIISYNNGALINFGNFTNGSIQKYPINPVTDYVNYHTDCSGFSNFTNKTWWIKYSNGTVIQESNSSSAASITNINLLDGKFVLNGFTIFNLTCRNSTDEVFSSERWMNTSNLKVVSSWLNASGGSYSYNPSFSYRCVDDENETMTGYVLMNGTTMATNGPVVNGSSVAYNGAYADGTWNMSVICRDSFFNSTASSIVFSKNTIPPGYHDCDSLFNGFAKFCIMMVIIFIIFAAAAGRNGAMIHWEKHQRMIMFMTFIILIGVFALVVLANMVNPCGI
jgi:hypothetical protein